MTPGLDAARAGNWAACLDELLAAWRTHRTPELAAMIELAGKRAATGPVRPTSAAIKKKLAALTSADITPLLETIERQARVSQMMKPYLLLLASRTPPDPRVADMLLRFLVRDDLQAFDHVLLTELVEHDDVRSRDLLREQAAGWQVRRARFHRRHTEIDRLIATASRTWPEYPPFTGDLAPLEALLAPDHKRDVESLLVAVYADLANDVPRLVYADALQDAGDPRGELITLQLTNPGTRREVQLLADHERAWLGPLDKVVQKSGVVWRRGFLAAARLAVRLLPEPVRSDRAWLTLEEIDLAEATGESLVRWLVTLPSLRRVYRMSCFDVRHLPAQVPWTHFGLLYMNLPLRLPEMPNLEELDLATLDVQEARAFYKQTKLRPARVRISVRRWIEDLFVPEDAEGLLVPGFEFPPIARFSPIRVRDRRAIVNHDKSSVTRSFTLDALRRLSLDSITVIASGRAKVLDDYLEALNRIAPTTAEIRP